MPRETRIARAAALLALVAATFVAGLAASTLAAGLLTKLGGWVHGAPASAAPAGTGRPGTDAAPPTGTQRFADAWAPAAQWLLDWMGSMLDAMRAFTSGDALGTCALAVAVLVSAAPAMIAAPALRRTPPEHPGRSLAWSVAGAAILGGACAVGILATVWDLVGLAATDAPGEPPQSLRGGAIVNPVILVPTWIAMGLPWAWAFARAGRAHAPDRLDRMVRWLVAGTCVELAIAAPTFVAASRRDSCTCTFGSWWAITAGATTLTILCGPALVLLATRRARREWMRAACHGCGYRRHGAQARCPECGEAFAAASPAVGAPRAPGAP